MKVNGTTGEVKMAWRDRRAIVLHAAAFVCEACKKATATEVDHVWPKSWGGRDNLSNLRATCLPCNRSKGGTAYLSDITFERAKWTADLRVATAASRLYDAALWQLVCDLMLESDISGEDAYNEARRLMPSQVQASLACAAFMRGLREERQASVDTATERPDPAPHPLDLALEMFAAVRGFDPDEPDEAA